MRRCLALAVAVIASACVSQHELALSKNVYRLDVDARGLIAMAAAEDSLSRRAAELTLSKGFTHYVIADASSERGRNFLGMTPSTSNTTVNVYGNTAYATTRTFGGGPIVQPTSRNSLIVVMFTAANAPANAIDARTVAAQPK